MRSRLLTRGLNERIQIRELRVSDYPQLNQNKNIDTSPENTRVFNGYTTSVRCNSSSPFVFNPLSFNTLHMFRSEIRGLSVINATAGGNTLNPAVFTGIPPVSSYFSNRYNQFFMPKNITSIVSTMAMALSSLDVFTTFSSLFVANAVIERNSNALLTPQNQSYLAIDARSSVAIRPTYPIIDRTQYRIGFTKSGVSQVRDRGVFENNVYDKNQFIRFIPNENLATETNRLNLFGIGMILLGYLDYREPNSLTSQNATWLLKQRTQYQRKFNPLKNLGT